MCISMQNKTKSQREPIESAQSGPMSTELTIFVRPYAHQAVGAVQVPPLSQAGREPCDIDPVLVAQCIERRERNLTVIKFEIHLKNRVMTDKTAWQIRIIQFIERAFRKRLPRSKHINDHLFAATFEVCFGGQRREPPRNENVVMRMAAINDLSQREQEQCAVHLRERSTFANHKRPIDQNLGPSSDVFPQLPHHWPHDQSACCSASDLFHQLPCDQSACCSSPDWFPTPAPAPGMSQFNDP